MTSRWPSQNPAVEVTGCDKESSDVTDRPQHCCSFYDDSLRPKSFLHDEVDEFNRVLADLLQSRQRPELTAAAEEDALMSCSSCSRDNKDDVFPMTRQDHLWTNCRIDDDFETRNRTDVVEHDALLDLQPSVAYRTAPCDDRQADDDDDDVDDDDDDEVLEIVEETDCPLTVKDCNVHSPLNILNDDLFNEVCQVCLHNSNNDGLNNSKTVLTTSPMGQLVFIMYRFLKFSSNVLEIYQPVHFFDLIQRIKMSMLAFQQILFFPPF